MCTTPRLNFRLLEIRQSNQRQNYQYLFNERIMVCKSTRPPEGIWSSELAKYKDMSVPFIHGVHQDFLLLEMSA